MVRGSLLLAIVAIALGCGSREEEAAELKAYVQTLQGFDSYNQRVEAAIVRFDDPTQEITMADLDKARTEPAEQLWEELADIHAGMLGVEGSGQH